MINTVHHIDCLIGMQNIPDKSIDMILCDLPYGTMLGQSKTRIYHAGDERHEWDEIIPTKKYYAIADRILRPNGRMILFAQEPFTTELKENALPSLRFNYRAFWLKDTLGSFMRSKNALLYRTEDILFFQKSHPKHDFDGVHPLRSYFKRVREFIGLNKKEIIAKIGQKADHVFRTESTQFSLCTYDTYTEIDVSFGLKKMQGFKEFAELRKEDLVYRDGLLVEMNSKYPSVFNLWQGGKYKDNVFEYRRDRGGLHPTQKPVELMEDLIKTYTNEGETVLDNCAGSGTTAIACINTNRNYILMEKEEKYYNIILDRIKKHVPQLKLIA